MNLEEERIERWRTNRSIAYYSKLRISSVVGIAG
jgi:hypothetical protein